MHIQPQPVAQAVHEIRSVRIFSNQGVDIPFQDPEPDQTGNHDAHHFAGHFLHGSPRTIQFERCLKGFENNVVNRALCRREFTVHREGTGDVPRIALIFATGVNQHQIAVAQRTFVFGVVQNAAVFPAADNGVVGGIARAVAVKFVVNFAFQLVFEHPGTAFLHGAGVCQRADFARAAHHI